MGSFVRNVAGKILPVTLVALLMATNASLAETRVVDPALADSTVKQDDDRRRTNGTIWDLFSNRDDPNVTIEVNKYIWNASLDVLDFLPIQSADPFTGVIVTGFGTPPGGRTQYRATIFVRDPALDARSLNLALATRSGPVPTATVRAIEDAILTRARQLRQRDGGL